MPEWQAPHRTARIHQTPKFVKCAGFAGEPPAAARETAAVWLSGNGSARPSTACGMLSEGHQRLLPARATRISARAPRIFCNFGIPNLEVEKCSFAAGMFLRRGGTQALVHRACGRTWAPTRWGMAGRRPSQAAGQPASLNTDVTTSPMGVPLPRAETPCKVLQGLGMASLSTARASTSCSECPFHSARTA